MSLEVEMIIDIERPHTMMIISTKIIKEKGNKITGLHHIEAIKGVMKILENRHMKVQRKDLWSGAAPFVLNGLHQKMVYEIIPVTSMIETLNQVCEGQYHLEVQREASLNGVALSVLTGSQGKRMLEITLKGYMTETLNQACVDKQCQKPIVVMDPNGTVHIVKQDSNQHLCAKSMPLEFTGKTSVDRYLLPNTQQL